jgi:hypothetical protein
MVSFRVFVASTFDGVGRFTSFFLPFLLKRLKLNRTTNQSQSQTKRVEKNKLLKNQTPTSRLDDDGSYRNITIVGRAEVNVFLTVKNKRLINLK